MCLNPGRMLVCLLSLHCTSVSALQSDRNQPIHLQADRVEINEKKETSRYQGRVRMQQGSLIIDADEVLVQMKDGRVDKLTIQGNPASFEQKPDRQEELVKSRADYMEYYAPQERLLLKSNAEVIQGKNLFRGDHIEYDTRNSTVKAQKGEGSDTRVQAIIQPAGKKDEKPRQDPPPP